MLDLAITGSGPAALAAAIYAGRSGLKTAVFEKDKLGGTLTEIAKIENYPGFIGTGTELAEILKKQVALAGVEIKYGACESINPLIIDGEEVETKAILVATGSEPRTLDFDPKIPVSYCVLCDAPLYKGKKVAVIGGGNSAVQESLHLAKLVDSVTIFTHSKLKAEPYLIEKISKLENIEIKENIEATAENLKDFAAVFVFIGKRPATSFLSKNILSEDGHIITENHQTTIPNLFAAGDVREGSIKQAITSAADGVEAVIEIMNYLKH